MVEDDILAIVGPLRPEDREHIRRLPEEDLIRLHRTFGLTLRNAFRSGLHRDLFRYCYQKEPPQTRSFDSISQTAIRLVWEYLRRSAQDAEPGTAPGPARR
jgi:hypothetical protein